MVGLALALHLAGIKLGAVFAAGAVFAVGFGFAMQNIAQNFVSGIISLIERTIKPGDVLEVGPQIVKVMKMSIRATIVRTLDDEDIIVPNSTLVQSNVKNYTLEDNLYRVKVKVGVSYESDLKQVRAVLTKAATDLPGRDAAYPPRTLLLISVRPPSSTKLRFGPTTLSTTASRAQTCARPSGWLSRARAFASLTRSSTCTCPKGSRPGSASQAQTSAGPKNRPRR